LSGLLTFLSLLIIFQVLITCIDPETNLCTLRPLHYLGEGYREARRVEQVKATVKTFISF
ncbi:hypothetical protein C0J52_20410, partial [Blattella germanica]